MMTHLVHRCMQDQERFRWLKRCCIAAAAPEAEAARRNWAYARKELFPPSAKDDYQHLRLSMFTDDVSRLPDEVIQVNILAPDFQFFGTESL